MSFPSDLVDALRPVVEALERLRVGYLVGGSVAFPLGERAYDRTALERAEEVELTADPVPLRVPMATAEDVILRKLEWSRRGDSVSEVQWRDVLGVLEIQSGELDREYLTTWAARLGVLDLLEQAFEEGGPDRR